MICCICQKKILPKEHYLCLEEFKNKKPSGRSYYHANCFKEKFLIQIEMRKTLTNMNSFLSGIKDKMQIKEVVNI